MSTQKIKKPHGKPVLQNFINKFDNTNVEIYEYDVKREKSRPNNPIKTKHLIPKWVLLVLTNLVLLLVLAAIAYGIFFGINSVSPRYYGDHCNTTSDCNEEQELICSNNKCLCADTNYYKAPSCVIKLSVNSECTQSEHCGYGLTCLTYSTDGEAKCMCSQDKFWNGSFCELKYHFDEGPCNSADECKHSRNMICSNKKCKCSTTTYWDGNDCVPLLDYEDFCSVSGSCKSNLQCFINENICNCATSLYWNGTRCVSQFNNGTSCTETRQCRTDLNLTCVNGICNCQPDEHLWGYCLKKVRNGESCVFPNVCDNTIGLKCSGSPSKCSCDTYYFYNGTACQPMIGNGMSCANSFVCNTTLGLKCDPSTLKCICDNDKYWNYQKCTNKQTNGSACINDIQCQTLNGLYCDLPTKTCLCNATNYYWNPKATNPKCELQKPFSQGCNNTCADWECREDLGLKCINNYCNCPNDMFWSSNKTKCLPKLTYGETCDGPYCQEYNGLSCNASKCNCSADHFWDTFKCTPQFRGNSTCLFDEQCLQREGLVCLASTIAPFGATCQCPTDMMHDYTIPGCVNKKSFGEFCDFHQECLSQRGLYCNSKKCQCLWTTHFWDATNKICTPQKFINVTCNANVECLSNSRLECKSNKCQCQDGYYWSSTYLVCIIKSGLDRVCDSDYECTDNKGFICDSTTNPKTCQCSKSTEVKSKMYWSSFENKCKSCPDHYFSNYIGITSRCYMYTNNSISTLYDKALKECNKERGSSLAIVRNQMELSLYSRWGIEQNVERFWLGSIGDCSGLPDNRCGNFKWNSRMTPNEGNVNNIFWCSDSPRNHSDCTHCTLFIRADSYCLRNHNFYPNAYICEIID